MTRGITTAAALCALAILPAAALAATYSGEGSSDPAAKIKLKVKNDDGKRKITKIKTRGLAYGDDPACPGEGRTVRSALTGSFKIKDDDTFKAVGQVSFDDPIDSGELKVKGEDKGKKLVGKMKFTFGKDGCTTDLTRFKATR